jgi:hypothetical protein
VADFVQPNRGIEHGDSKDDRDPRFHEIGPMLPLLRDIFSSRKSCGAPALHGKGPDSRWRRCQRRSGAPPPSLQRGRRCLPRSARRSGDC